MAKYSKKLVERIIELIEEDVFNVSQICTMTGINRKTFYEWKKTKPEFAKAANEAYYRSIQRLADRARASLARQMEGTMVTYTTYKYIPDEYGELVLKEKVVRIKECPPDAKVIKLVLDREKELKVKEEQNPPQRPQELHVTVKNEEEAIEYKKILEVFNYVNANGGPIPIHIRQEYEMRKALKEEGLIE